MGVELWCKIFSSRVTKEILYIITFYAKVFLGQRSLSPNCKVCFPKHPNPEEVRMILDLEKASKAIDAIQSDKGKKALEELYGTLQAFRSQLGGDLNEAEFRYVMQTLFNEQVVTAHGAEAAKPATTLAHGFTLRQVI
jgi:hypothetical protein